MPMLTGRGSLDQILHEVGAALQSGDDWEERVVRVLELVRLIVPYEHCALLEAPAGGGERPAAGPESPQTEMVSRLCARLGTQPDEERRRGRSTPHLAIPLVALDEVIGVLQVSRAHGAYTQRHRRSLTLVAAQLAAYLGMLRARAERARATEEMPARPNGRALAGIRVLLVEDDADIREGLQLVLERHGAEVRPEASAPAALAALAVWRPDVLLSDLAMPGQSGYALMQELAARETPPPAAALTAAPTPEGREQALAAGFLYYLAKTLEAVDLVAVVASLAGRPAPEPPPHDEP